MSVVNILIDSSILKKDPFLERTKEGRWLKALAKEKKIIIFLHHIVENEVRSQLLIDMQPKLKTLNDSVNLFHKCLPISMDKNFLDLFSKNISIYSTEFENKINDFYSGEIFSRVNGLKEHVDKVFEDYFSGEANFSERKAKKDLPDAFLYQFVRSFSEENRLICLVNDNGLASACEKLKNVTVYRNLEDILLNSDISLEVDNFKNKMLQRNMEMLLLSYIDHKKLFENHFPFHIKEYLRSTMPGVVLNYSDLNSFNDEIVFEDLYTVKVEDKSTISYVPENAMSIQFRCLIHADVGYLAMIDDTYDLDEYVTHLHESSSRELVSVSEEVKITFKFEILLNFPNDLWNSFLSFRKIKLDEQEIFELRYNDLKEQHKDEAFLNGIFNEDNIQLSKYRILKVQRIPVRKGDSDYYVNFCTTCGAPVGSCEH